MTLETMLRINITVTSLFAVALAVVAAVLDMLGSIITIMGTRMPLMMNVPGMSVSASGVRCIASSGET
jgi:hypothetical protein